jgi:hypothetical protein
VIERFNFYDLYGYLIPGLALLGALWLPLWWLAQKEIPGAWLSAAVALVVAYLTGHVVARIGQTGFPYDKPRGLQPSDGLLDAQDRRLPDSVKQQIVAAIERYFALRLSAVHPNERARSLRTAFFLCRRALLREDAASYAEQFEGLYTMLRGLAAVGAMSCSYYLGWATAALLATSELITALQYSAPVILIGVILLAERPCERPGQPPWLFLLMAALLFPLGIYLGATQVTRALSSDEILRLLVLAVASFFLSVRFYLGYRYFAEQFAITVYRDFFVLQRMSSARTGL